MSGNRSVKAGITLEAIFKPGGILQRRLPQYEYRPSQWMMSEAVLDAIRNRHSLCVEAGTGTGKTLAYLIAALSSSQRVIVSTATKNLQDQIFFKDIPFVRKHVFPELAATYMKGRNNYLCLRRFHEPGPLDQSWEDQEECRKALKQWVGKTESGDRAEISWMRDDSPLWSHLDARSDTCTGQKCSYFEQCYVTRMRQKALESDLIVVNHALFFSNLALEKDEIGGVLPNFGVLILDEAHQVEDMAATYFGKQISNHQVEELCRDLGSLYHRSRRVSKLVDHTQIASAAFHDAFPGNPGRHSLNLHPQPGGGTCDLRKQVWKPFQRLRDSLLSLYHHLEGRISNPVESEPLLRRLEQMTGTLEEVFNLEDSEKVYWFERRARGLFLHVNPIDVAPILQEKLFSRTETTIFTSATLTTNSNFDYFRGRLGIPHPRELVTPSEFNYSQQAVLYIPRSFPEPRSPHYLDRALHEVKQILEITRGNAFLLFTSLAQMDRVYQALGRDIPFPLFRQRDLPKSELLQKFRETPHAVLCATSSFWQGVDVQGEALSAVIIDKLPFSVPSDPLVAARINSLEKKGENSFQCYTVPAAIISLKQGLGRLVRSRQDRGILAILDSRLRTRSYGSLFLESLPNCPVTDNIGVLRHFYHQNGSMKDVGVPYEG